MKEHDILEALGNVSEETIEKYALPRSKPSETAGRECITMTETNTVSAKKQKKPIHISRTGIAAAIALCIGANVLLFAGLSQMKKPRSPMETPGMSPSDIVEIGTPHMEVQQAAPNYAVVKLVNPGSEQAAYSMNYGLRRDGELIQLLNPVHDDDPDYATDTAYTLDAQSEREQVFWLGYLEADTSYELISLKEDGKTESEFGSVTFEIPQEFYDNMQWIEIETGQPEGKVQSLLEMHGITVKTVEADAPNPDYLPFDVLSIQYEGPEHRKEWAGYWIQNDSTVTLTINPGTEIDEQNRRVMLPDCTGWDYETAKTTILSMGLYVDKRSAYDPEVPMGLIIEQEPAGETEVKAGTYVKLTVSLGPNPDEAETGAAVIVPDCVGMDFELAKQVLLGKGFYVDKRSAYDPEIPEGYVIAQDPLPGTEGESGKTYVQVRVSLGPNPDDANP